MADVAEHRTGFGQGPTADPPRRPEYLNPAEFAADRRSLSQSRSAAVSSSSPTNFISAEETR